MKPNLSRFEFRPLYTRQDAIKMHNKFYAAMFAARRAGLEHFRIGVIVDHTPMVPTRFEIMPSSSFMQSAGAACAEDGDNSYRGKWKDF